MRISLERARERRALNRRRSSQEASCATASKEPHRFGSVYYHQSTMDSYAVSPPRGASSRDFNPATPSGPATEHAMHDVRRTAGRRTRVMHDSIALLAAPNFPKHPFSPPSYLGHGVHRRHWALARLRHGTTKACTGWHRCVRVFEAKRRC
jgi:hypothetical protein